MLCYNKMQHGKKVKNATYIAFKMRFLRFLHLVCDYYTRKNQNAVSGFLWKKTAPALGFDGNFEKELRNLVIMGGNENDVGTNAGVA